MQCPFCGCRRFYIKDSDDEYETYEFDISGGNVRFSCDMDPAKTPEVSEETHAYCKNCSWHGKIREL